MRRTIDLRAVAAIILLSVTGLAVAQNAASTPSTERSSRRTQPAASPSQEAPSLAERLAQIRARMATDKAAASPASLDPSDVGQPTGPAVRVAELPETPGLYSVLKDRAATDSTTPAAPRELDALNSGPMTRISGAPATPAPSANVGPVDSSRRTARRMRSPSQYTPAAPPATPQDSARVTLVQQTPQIQIETDGPKAIAVGKAAHYRVRLINKGASAAAQITVAISLPATVEILNTAARLGTVDHAATRAESQTLAWQVGQVPARSQHELEITLRPKTNAPMQLQVNWQYRPAAVTAQIEVQQPKLDVKLSGPTDMQFGETAVFTVRVSNPGNGPAENVTVQLAATGAVAQPNRLGKLAAGETRQMEVELKAGKAGAMEIRADARGADNLQAQALHSVHVRRAQLAILVVAPPLVYSGAAAAYQVQITNTGDATATDVQLAVDLPSGAEQGLGIDNKKITGPRGQWQIGDLKAGTRRTYNFSCMLTAAGQNAVRAGLQATDGMTATDSAITQVEAIADLKIVVNDPKGPVPVGQEITYEVQVFNRGSKEARNVAVVAQFSEGVEPTAASGQPSEIVPGQVIFAPMQMLPAGGKVVLKITAKATTPGSLRFRAELTCPDPDTKLVSEETTQFYSRAASVGTSPATTTAARPPVAPTPARR